MMSRFGKNLSRRRYFVLPRKSRLCNHVHMVWDILYHIDFGRVDGFNGANTPNTSEKIFS